MAKDNRLTSAPVPGWMPWRRFALAQDVPGYFAQVEEIRKMDWGFGIKTPALFISTSIRPNRDTAVSTIFAAVRGSPMSPSTSATFVAVENGFAVVMFREFATTL